MDQKSANCKANTFLPHKAENHIYNNLDCVINKITLTIDLESESCMGK